MPEWKVLSRLSCAEMVPYLLMYIEKLSVKDFWKVKKSKCSFGQKNKIVHLLRLEQHAAAVG